MWLATMNNKNRFKMAEEADSSDHQKNHSRLQALTEFPHITVEGDDGEVSNGDAATIASAHPSPLVGQWPRREATDCHSLISPRYSTLNQQDNVPYFTNRNVDIRSPLLPRCRETSDQEQRSKEIVTKPSLPVPDTTISFQSTASPQTPTTARSDHGCSVSQTVFNGVNAYVGIGLLSMPSTVQEGGWVSVVLLILFAVIGYITGNLLRKCLDKDKQIITYPDIGQAAFGKYGHLFLSIIFYIEIYLCLVEFIILEADNLAKLFPRASIQLGSLYLSPEHFLGIIATLVVLPSCYMKDLRSISFLSAGGVLGAILLVFALILVGTQNNIGFHQTGPVMKWSGVSYALGVVGFCYSGHAVLPNLYHSMSDKKKFNMTLLLCFGLSTLIYSAVAVLGFLMFGKETESQITLNLPSNSIASQFGLWIAVECTLFIDKYALMLLPLSRSLEGLLPPRVGNKYWCLILLRTILVASTVCVAFLVPFFGLLMALAGSLLCMLTSFIMPPLCYLRIVGKSTSLEMSMYYAVALGGVVVAVLGTYSSLCGIINSY